MIHVVFWIMTVCCQVCGWPCWQEHVASMFRQWRQHVSVNMCTCHWVTCFHHAAYHSKIINSFNFSLLWQYICHWMAGWIIDCFTQYQLRGLFPVKWCVRMICLGKVGGLEEEVITSHFRGLSWHFVGGTGKPWKTCPNNPVQDPNKAASQEQVWHNTAWSNLLDILQNF
jgi:hypothetical protein